MGKALPIAIVGISAAAIAGAILVARGEGEPSPDNLVISLGTNVKNGGAPLTVEFQGFAEGGKPSYQFAWSFGDGETGQGEVISHTYVNPGTYQAQLTVMDSEGTTKLKAVTINVTGDDPGDPPPIPGDVTVVMITTDDLIFNANLSNLRSDIEIKGKIRWQLYEGTVIDSNFKIDDMIQAITLEPSGSASPTYGRPGNLSPGQYLLSAKYETEGGLDLGEDKRGFLIEGQIECEPGFHLENGVCVPDDIPTIDPKFGDATITIDQLQETIFRTSIKNELVDSWGATLTQRVLDSNGNEVFKKISNFTLNEFQLKQISAFIPSLSDGNYTFESEVIHTPKGTIIGSKVLNFSVSGSIEDKKMSLDWRKLDCFTFNPSSNFFWDIICGGTIELHNKGNVPIIPILELFVKISSPLQNETLNLAIVYTQGTIQPGEKKLVFFNLPFITMNSPAIVVNTLEVRDSDNNVLDSAVKKYTLRDDGVIVKT